MRKATFYDRLPGCLRNEFYLLFFFFAVFFATLFTAFLAVFFRVFFVILTSLLAIFEVTPAGSDSLSNGAYPAQVSLKYTLPTTKIVKELKHDCLNNYKAFEEIDKEFQFATSIAMFGMKLRQSKYFPITDWSNTEKIALMSYNPANYLQKGFIDLIAVAKKIYVKKRRKTND